MGVNSGCNMKTGCIIIGALELIGGISAIGGLGHLLVKVSHRLKDLRENNSVCSWLLGESQCQAEAMALWHYKVHYGFLLAWIIYGAFYMQAGTFLVYAAKKENPKLLHIWTVIASILLALAVALVITHVALIKLMNIGVFVVLPIIVLVSGCLILLVKSYRKQLLEDRMRKLLIRHQK